MSDYDVPAGWYWTFGNPDEWGGERGRTFSQRITHSSPASPGGVTLRVVAFRHEGGPGWEMFGYWEHHRLPEGFVRVHLGTLPHSTRPAEVCRTADAEMDKQDAIGKLTRLAMEAYR